METPKSRRRGWMAPTAVFAIAFCIFARSIAFDFVWDDWLVIVRNPRINPPEWESAIYYWTHVAWNLYMPVTCCAWLALSWLGQLPNPTTVDVSLNPYVFHLANVLLHAAAAVAVYRVLMLVVRRRGPAIAGALLFAVHPLQVETVCFVGAMNNALGALFGFLALADYLKAVADGTSSRRTLLLYGRASLLLILAMLSRPMAVVLPVIAVALDVPAFRRPLRATIKSAIPWVILVLPCAVWTKLMQHGAAAIVAVPPMFRLAIAADSIGMNFWHVLNPTGLGIDYGRTPALLYAHPAMLLTSIFTVVLIAVGLLTCRRAPILSGAISIFIVGLLPNSGLVPFDFQEFSTVADRYAYIAMLGPALLLAWTLSRPAAVARPQLATAAVAVILAVLSILNVRQSGYWRDDRALFSRAVEINPDSWLGHENLAFALLSSDLSAAAHESELAIGLRPQVTRAYRMLALARLKQQRPLDAENALRRALGINPADPANRSLLASILEKQGDFSAAIAEYRKCLEADPHNAGLHIDLAAALAEAGRFEEAADHYRRATQIDPNLRAARKGLRLVTEKMADRKTPN